MTFDPDALDPGIRKTVEMLRSWGYNTTDSGDGVSKVIQGWAEDEVLDIAHVFIDVRPEWMITCALALRSRLQANGIRVHEEGSGLPSISASFDPTNRIAVIAVMGLNDSMLPEDPI